MARRGRERFEKRRRERDRQERAAAKRARSEERRHADQGPDDDGTDEAELLEQFRVLNERHAAGEIEPEHFARRRHELLAALGVEDAAD